MTYKETIQNDLPVLPAPVVTISQWHYRAALDTAIRLPGGKSNKIIDCSDISDTDSTGITKRYTHGQHLPDW